MQRLTSIQTPGSSTRSPYRITYWRTGLLLCLAFVMSFTSLSTDISGPCNETATPVPLKNPSSSAAAIGPSAHPAPDISLHFRHVAGAQELQLFTTSYTNRFGEPFTVNRFKYYISHILVIDADNKKHPLSDKIYLIDEADSLSKHLTFPAPAATARYLCFTIGVDSMYNVSGVQSGDLDPYKGMFWTWNSGYIFAKLEGKSDSSHAPAHYFTWDIGGYKQPNAAYRNITLPLPGEIPASTSTSFTILADVLKWFDGVTPLRIAQQPQCHQPGKLALQLADNYATMFSIAP